MDKPYIDWGSIADSLTMRYENFGLRKNYRDQLPAILLTLAEYYVFPPHMVNLRSLKESLVNLLDEDEDKIEEILKASIVLKELKSAELETA